MAGRFLDVADLIDNSRIGVLQWRVFIACAIVAALDGFDTQSIGYTAPMVAAVVKAPMSSFGAIFSAGLVGATVGALCFGPLADRFGRKWLLVAACLLFSIFTALTIRVTSLHELLALRFLAGLGLGGATPSFLAMGAEYAPKRLRAFIVTSLFAAFPFGGFIGGLLASYLIPSYGWQSIFMIGGVTPLVLVIFVARFLPELLRFLLATNTSPAAITRIVGQIVPDVDLTDAQFVSTETRHARGSRVIGLFQEGRAARTVILWIPFFMGFMILLSITAWTPSLLKSAAIPLSDAVLVIAGNNLGSVVGTSLSGYLVGRFGPSHTLVPGFILGAISLAGLAPLPAV